MTGIKRRLLALTPLLVLMLLQGCDSDQQSVSQPAVDAVKATTEQTQPDPLATVLAGDHRSPENKARDEYRHPAETLQFFGLRPDSTVVEVWPGAGWYTEVIAPYVRGQGKFIAAGFDPDSEIDFIRAGVARYQAKLAERPDLYDQVEMAVLMPPDKVEFVPAESVDIILTFRSIHNWMPRDMQGVMLGAMYRALKPGGVLGAVDHRWHDAKTEDPDAENGYVSEERIINACKSSRV